MEKTIFQYSTIGIVSRDPFFLFTLKSLLGRDRFSRIYVVAENLEELNSKKNYFDNIHVLICDLDSLKVTSTLFDEFGATISQYKDLKIICLLESLLSEVISLADSNSVNALLLKHDIGYCIHLVVQAVRISKHLLISEGIKEILGSDYLRSKRYRVVGQEIPYPSLTARVTEVTLWRTLIGLDNQDIQDEMVLESSTVREYVSKGYKALGANSELDAFESLSEWWWTTRFADTVAS